MYHIYDVILVGIGLANGLIALKLQQKYPNMSILLIEKNKKPCGNHTWSFHASDISLEEYFWIKPLIKYSWTHYYVRFPEYTRKINSHYYSISSKRFADLLKKIFGKKLLTDTEVLHLTSKTVQIKNGHIYKAYTIIDGRGYESNNSIINSFQVFLGQEWQLKYPHHLDAPILIDTNVNQKESYHFIYTLPLSKTRLLIEDTHYTNNYKLKKKQACSNIEFYAKKQKWKLDKLLNEEHGILPITLTGDIKSFWQNKKIPVSGLRGGFFHHTTGYSIQFAIHLANYIAKNITSSEKLRKIIKSFSYKIWQHQRFFRILNRIFFLAVPIDEQWKIIQKFYKLPEHIISSFYSCKLTFFDKIQILTCKPQISIIPTLYYILKK